MSDLTEEARSSVEAAITAIRDGGFVLVVDEPSRENEGDLVMAAEHVTPEAVNFMATHGRGLICVPMVAERLEDLGIPPMARRSTDPLGTAFHVGVDLLGRTSTGISAGDRALTIAALASSDSRAEDFSQPGHVFPLAYAPGGVTARRGHTEASVDLAKLAGCAPTAVICEIAGPDGEMMRYPELQVFAREHAMPIVAITDLVAYQLARTPGVTRVAAARVPLDQGAFTLIGYLDELDGREHVVACMGDLSELDSPLVRVHSECLTGDVFGSQRCDCGDQLDLALTRIAAEGHGAVIYLRGHEGRGIGLLQKLRAYDLQDHGLDTVDANAALGFPADMRDYRVAAEILNDLGLRNVRLMTNNPDKLVGLRQYGASVAGCEPLLAPPTTENVRYLDTKRAKMGHWLEPSELSRATGSEVLASTP